MSHKSQTELSAKLEQAKRLIPIHALYTHYKNSSRHYKVIGYAILEAHDEVGIIYQAEYGDHITYVRPLSSWLSKVKINGMNIQRFSRQE